ncbi:MAG: WD40/YVTN/BNR-like repeat-containing protein [Desulfobacterales bacterium]
MSSILYLATEAGLSIAEEEGGEWRVLGRGLAGESLTSVAVGEGFTLAGSPTGIRRSAADGREWHPSGAGLTIDHVRWLERLPGPSGILLAGTEPAGIYISMDGGESWRGKPEVERLRDANGWFLPYSPGAGCIRGFAAEETPAGAIRIYAAAEVGGVLVSTDSGESWGLAEGSDGRPEWKRNLASKIHPDVHSLAVRTRNADEVLAATGGGIYRSADGGQTWRLVYSCYVRAVWMDPESTDRIIAGPADGVSRNGRIEASDDGGATWHAASKGMQAPWRRHMVERFVQVDERLLAVLSNGELWESHRPYAHWNRILEDAPGVRAVAARRAS